jgi:DNA-binding transcriptional ArsR family regulator
MLECVFGNQTAEKVLLHIFHYNETYASAIAKDYGVSKTPILNPLERFEIGGILKSRGVGRSRLYSFNNKSPLTKHVKAMIEVLYKQIPMEEKQILFQTRRRPRRKGKPVL